VFDRGDDGFVGTGELWNVLRRLRKQLSDSTAAREDCCARMTAAHDADGDGWISFREFRAMMEHAA
jgi:Ca2+-binding EF-hand superfamily protein